jgi:hypothetical protein
MDRLMFRSLKGIQAVELEEAYGIKHRPIHFNPCKGFSGLTLSNLNCQWLQHIMGWLNRSALYSC